MANARTTSIAEVVAIGDMPDWLAERMRSEPGIGLSMQRGRSSDSDTLLKRVSGAYVWVGAKAELPCDANILASSAKDLWIHDERNCRTIVLEALDRLSRLARICRKLEKEFGFVGVTQATRTLRRQIAEAALLGDVPVLFQGDTGTGKMFAARALSAIDRSRKGSGFATLDCGATTPEMFASDIFGHLRGSFTGAERARDGAIVTAGSGYLALDEIGELPSILQASLLGVLQEMRFKPVGSDQDYPVRCRIVGLTNRDLSRSSAEGRFRSDLLYRLDGMKITVPTLAERQGDIAQIFAELVKRAAGQELAVSQAVSQLLCESTLPGNVRQLEMAARIAVAQRGKGGEVRLAHLPNWLREGETTPIRSERESKVSLIGSMLEDRAALEDIVSACRSRAVELKLEQLRGQHPTEKRSALVRRAARQLKVSERTVYYRLNGHGGH